MSENTKTTNIPVKCITNIDSLTVWQKSPAYNEITKFIAQLNDFARASHESISDISLITDKSLLHIVKLLNNLNDILTEVPAIQDDPSQRFGNKAYRVWFDKMKQLVSESMVTLSTIHASELSCYLVDSFGNQQRIDYGTGHELNFIIFLLGVYKLLLLPSSPEDISASSSTNYSEEQLRTISKQLLCLFGFVYMPLVRKIQLQYKLEPAGSHGVYSLDDFQFLPFVWGSAQLIDHKQITPGSFPEKEIARKYSNNFMFHASIYFIHQVKTGPFAEHSNQLWNISGLDDWSKINRGLMRMYKDEVLHKFPIVQHLLFGANVFQWKP